MSTATAEKKTVSFGKITVPVIDLDDARKPAYAWVGVADLVIEQVKEVPADLQARSKKLSVPAQVKDLPATLKELPAKTVSSAKELPAQAKTRVTEARGEASARYTDLVARGEKLVGQIRRQQATQDAIAEGKRAVQKAEAAANNAKRAAKAAAKATEDAAAKIG